MYFLSPSPSHGVPSFLGFENLFAIYIYIYMYEKQEVKTFNKTEILSLSNLSTVLMVSSNYNTVFFQRAAYLTTVFTSYIIQNKNTS